MSVLIIFIKLIAVFDLLVIAVYFGGDILSTMLNKLRRKPKQEDFFDFFVPGEDFDFFDGTEDLLTKIEYYLSHEKERKDIAENGFCKVAKQHTYLHRVRTMLETAGL